MLNLECRYDQGHQKDLVSDHWSCLMTHLCLNCSRLCCFLNSLCLPTIASIDLTASLFPTFLSSYPFLAFDVSLSPILGLPISI